MEEVREEAPVVSVTLERFDVLDGDGNLDFTNVLFLMLLLLSFLSTRQRSLAGASSSSSMRHCAFVIVMPFGSGGKCYVPGVWSC